MIQFESRRVAKKESTVVLYVLVSILAIGMIAAYRFLDGIVVQEEIHRVTSPNRLIDAIVYTRDAGATTSIGYFVTLADRGSRDYRGTIFQATHSRDVSVKWNGDRLQVSYAEDANVRSKLLSIYRGGQQIGVDYQIESESTNQADR